MIASRKRPLDGGVFLACKSLPDSAVCFPVNQVLLMDEARAKIFSPDSAPSFGLWCHRQCSENELTPHPEEDDGND